MAFAFLRILYDLRSQFKAGRDAFQVGGAQCRIGCRMDVYPIGGRFALQRLVSNYEADESVENFGGRPDLALKCGVNKKVSWTINLLLL